MSVLRKEEPITTADIANQRRANTNSGNTIMGDTIMEDTLVDPTDRRPPQSAAVDIDDVDTVDTPDTANAVGTTKLDDTYDGEIVTSSTGPAIRSSTVRNDDRRPVSESAYQTIPTAARSQSASPVAQAADGRNNSGALFHEDELRDFRARWDQVQTSFVDEPRHAVEQADTLVATVVKHIAEQFAEERAKLEKQWDRGDNVSTEDLRQGFKRYRAFFDRLLAF
jgi:hypothetical protein